jgi:hypothetical protein
MRSTGAAAEQRLEEIARVEVGAERAAAAEAAARPAAAELEAGIPVRRRLELLAGLPVAAHLVVGGPLLRIPQDLVGLVDLLEALLGVGGLAHVRVVLAGELAVGLLDVVLRGRARHAEGVVVVLVFHRSVSASR